MRSIVIYALLGIVMLTGLALRTWNVNFDGGLNAHPDELDNACLYAPNIGWPSSLDEFLDPQRSPLNPLWDRQNDRRRSFTCGHFARDAISIQNQYESWSRFVNSQTSASSSLGGCKTS